MNLKLMKKLCGFKKEQLQIMLLKYLKSKGYTNIKATNMYIIAEGTLPVCLIAHMDTVFSLSPRTFYYDKEQTVLWSPDGLGADDRAGIYAIINLIEAGYRPSLIFTDMEERGGIGASTLIAQYPDCPFVECKALIELDRQGKDDAVFYDCDNKTFTELILGYDFKKEWGTFTDISIIAPAWNIAAVNLSVGYYNEHQKIETFNIYECHLTINKVDKMLHDCKQWSSYCYIPADKTAKIQWWNVNSCTCCGKYLGDKEGRLIGGGRIEDCYLMCDACYDKYKNYLMN